MYFLVICIALAVALCKGQDCIGGALFDDYNINSNNIDEYQPIRETWYINLNKPCTCSGKVLKYKVEYYELDDEGRYVAYAAMWRPREEPELGCLYDVVDSSPTKFDIEEDKRKKRDGDPSDNDDIDVSDNNLYVRKGSVVGIYFQDTKKRLPVIGEASSAGGSVCKISGDNSTQILNCTSSDSIETNLVIFAEAQIERIECNNAPNNYGNTEDRDYIDGDREYGARVHYECITGYTDTNSHDYLTCDENENWVGTIPNCVQVTCDNITSLPNGNVNNANGFTYQSMVTFSCNTGYNLNGTSSIMCQDDRDWSDDIPTCDIVECQDQDMPENGYKSDYNLTYGSSIQFGCENGYDLSGDSFITCEADGTWNGTIPNCILVSCPVINNPENGSKNSSLISFGSIVSFNCDEGYYLNGTDAIVCEADMFWSDSIPSCFLINCGNPGATPSNGSTAEGSDYSYGSVVTFNCDNGYELIGSISIICGNDSNWNASIPVCNLVSCDSPVIDNYTNVSSNTYTYQSVIEFECITGYELNGNTSATCLANGEWNVTSPSCEPVTCDLPASPVNGTIANEPSLTFDTFIEYECDIGYTIIGWPVIVCNASKEWNGTVPTCEIVVCESPNTPVNGKNLTDEEGFVYQSIVEYECDDGYELEGNSSIVCTAQGNWNSLIPVCNPVDCGEPDQIEYGEQIGSNYTYGYSIVYDCEIGYILTGSNVLQCTENGTWNGSAPVCELVQCDNVSVLNGIKFGDNHTYGSVLNFSCTEGYNLNGTATITCQSNGEWSLSIPTCIPVDCGDPGTPIMGSQNINVTYTFGSLVTFTCYEGYELLQNESNTTMCQADGNWTNADLPNCSIVNCEPPESPANGQIEGNVFTYGSTINFTCNTGFVLVGEPMIVCLEDKNWSSEIPICHQTCSKLQVSFPLSIVNEKNDYLVGDVIAFSCSSSYNLNGQNSLSCNGNGQWNGAIPTCEMSTVTTSNIANSVISTSNSVISTSTVSSSVVTVFPTEDNVGNNAGSGPILYGPVVGVVIIIAIILIATILILLFFKNQNLKKKAYNVSNNGGIECPIEMYSSVTIATTSNQDNAPTDNGMVAVYEVPITLTRSHTDTMVKRPHEVPMTLPRSHTTVQKYTPYEVPVTLQRGQTNTIIEEETATADKKDILQSPYEVPIKTATLVKTNLSSQREGPSDFELPPAIADTSFIYNELSVQIDEDRTELDEEPQVYSELNEAFEQTPMNNTTDVTNFLYSEISIDLPMNISTTTLQKPTITERSSIDEQLPVQIGDDGMELDEVPQVYSELDQAFEQTPMNNTTDVTNLLYTETTTLEKTSTAKRKTMIFEPPATQTDELFMQFKRQKVRGIKNESILIGKTIGSGYFGNVCKGDMITDPNEDTIAVAIKTLNDSATEGEKIKFLQEAAVMAQFDHTNVLKLHGVVVTKKTCMIVTELMTKGDLLKVLHKMRPDPGLLTNEDIPFTLLNFCRQVCFGLSHLSQKGFVHRDIAARNILVDANGTCKIADFGLSRDLDDDDYYMANEGAKVPVKWTAPEALHYRKYSLASDVWSYGCLLYEIWSLGAKPFVKMTNIQSLEKIDKGYRLPPPPGCPKEFYNIMITCWHPDKDARPCFQDIMLMMLKQDKEILSIPEEDVTTHPLAGAIGATLEAGEKMYQKLQMTYS